MKKSQTKKEGRKERKKERKKEREKETRKKIPLDSTFVRWVEGARHDVPLALAQNLVIRIGTHFL
jgi:hypothetical protein